jgi:hypothetical protein
MIALQVLILVFLVLGAVSLVASQARIHRRLRRIEQRLDRLTGRFEPLDSAGASPQLPGRQNDLPGAAGLDPQQDDMARSEVISLLRQNQKIQAIKAYRQATGVGLKQAKAAVEALQRQLLL